MRFRPALVPSPCRHKQAWPQGGAVGPLEDGLPEVGPVEVGFAEVGLAEIGRVEVGSGKV